MSDISTSWNAALGVGDWVLTLPRDGLITDETGGSVTDDMGGAIGDGLFTGGGIVVGNDLGTAVLISLFTDRTAEADDTIVDGSTNPRGWWGDLGADRPIGSKLWLRMRSKQTDLTLALVKDDITQALAWLIDDGIAARVDVLTEWTRPGMLGAKITIYRANGTTTALRFDWAWKEV